MTTTYALLQEDTYRNNDIDQHLMKITASLLTASDQHISHEKFRHYTLNNTGKTAVYTKLNMILEMHADHGKLTGHRNQEMHTRF